MSRKLDELLNEYSWNSLQIHQLRLADKKNLTLEYFSPVYDWEQLREIRLCLEDGLNPSFLLNQHMDANVMEKARLEVLEMSGTFEEKEERNKKRKLNRLIISSTVVIVLIIMVFTAIWKREFIIASLSPLEINLSCEEYEIGISEVSAFSYSDLIEDYTEGAILSLPDVEIEDIGEYTLVYTVSNISKSTSEQVILTVVDDISPTLSLTKTSVTLTEGDSFSARKYIDSVSDNVDDLDKEDVEIDSDVDSSKSGKYTVTYTLADSSGNSTEQSLSVTVKEEEKSSSSSSDSGSSSDNSSESSSSSSSSKKSSTKPASKMFYVEDYGTFDACLNACQSYINKCLKTYSGTGTATPITEDGIYIGYKAVFS